MSRFTDILLVSPLGDGKTWVIMRDFGYDVHAENSGDRIDVPVGFQTDFATVPRLFWIVLPKWGKYGNAAVIHDWLYWTQARSRRRADDIFLEAMGVLGVRRVTRYAMYWAVRLFGWLAWYRNRLDRAQGFDRVLHALPERSSQACARPALIRRLGARAWRGMRGASLAVLALGAVTASAQEPRKSQQGAVMQIVANTRIEIRYSRPVARGRKLFGELVPWGRVWAPGADTATSISVSTPVRVNGQTLPAGTYSVWAIPRPDTWTVIFSRAHPVWHIPYPEGRDVLRVEAPAREGSHMETLTFYFPVVDGHAAELYLHWGTTIVPLSIRVN